ncbi:helix-turn-helix transcriptional regulator [Rhizobium leguminosarum]|uniref:helix-turn-helix transcriptional regulator n=1 Tax=Rhizobium leguminosarum TaxID=384 RepID=UPI003F95BB3A
MKTEKKSAPSENLCAEGMIRLPQVLSFIPVSRSTVYAKVRSGEWPAPVRISKRVVAWKLRDILDLLDRLGQGEAS